jgi:hypothetical protein
MSAKSIEARVVRLEDAAQSRGLVDHRTAEQRLQERWLHSLNDAELETLEGALRKRDYAQGDGQWCRMPGCECANHPPETDFDKSDEQVILGFQVMQSKWLEANR